MKNPLPTVSQIREVKHLHSTRLFSQAAISRQSGVPLHRSRLMLTSFDSPSKPTASKRPGGNCDATATLPVHAGLHRLFAALRADAE